MSTKIPFKERCEHWLEDEDERKQMLKDIDDADEWKRVAFTVHQLHTQIHAGIVLITAHMTLAKIHQEQSDTSECSPLVQLIEKQVSAYRDALNKRFPPTKEDPPEHDPPHNPNLDGGNPPENDPQNNPPLQSYASVSR